MARAKKDFARALEALPRLIFASEIYDYDLALQKLVCDGAFVEMLAEHLRQKYETDNKN